MCWAGVLSIHSTEHDAQKLNRMNGEKISVENKIDLSRCSCVHNLQIYILIICGIDYERMYYSDVP